MYANEKRNVITKETLKWQLSVSVGNKGLFNGANSIHMWVWKSRNTKRKERKVKGNEAEECNDWSTWRGKMMYKSVRSKVLELRVWSTWVGSMKYEKLQDEVQELMGVSTRINGMKNSRHAIS